MYVINGYQRKMMALQAQLLPVRFLVICDQNVRPFHTNKAGTVPCQTIHGLLEDVKESGSLLRLPFLTLSDSPFLPQAFGAGLLSATAEEATAGVMSVSLGPVSYLASETIFAVTELCRLRSKTVGDSTGRPGSIYTFILVPFLVSVSKINFKH